MRSIFTMSHPSEVVFVIIVYVLVYVINLIMIGWIRNESNCYYSMNKVTLTSYGNS